MHHARAILAAASLATLAACAGRSSSLEVLNATPPQEFRGHFTSRAGSSWFQPCGAAATEPEWWVTLTGAAVVQADSARRNGQLVDGARTFVRWRAVLTRGGEVGPPGATALLVRDVLAMRAESAGDCAAP